jgi:aspartate racemase
MSTVGLVGGLGPESTIDYYRRVLEAWARVRPGSAPGIVIDSLDVQQALRLVQGDRAALITYLSGSLDRLAGAGVDFAALTANTPHLVFDELAAHSRVPLISIVETCAKPHTISASGDSCCSARATMEGARSTRRCARARHHIVSLEAADMGWVHERYVGELLNGFPRRHAAAVRGDRGRCAARIGRRGRDPGRNGLPLLLRDSANRRDPALDTTTASTRSWSACCGSQMPVCPAPERTCTLAVRPDPA